MYKVIYADPPWNWRAWSKKGEDRSAKKHYPVMTLEAIKNLGIESIADVNSVLFLWAIDPMLDVAFDVIKAWGFEYKTVGFYWIKTNVKTDGFFTGLGYYTRSNPEQCLLATRGKPLERLDKGVRKLVVSPRGRHSEKPREVRDRITRLYGNIPRVELFAREQIADWDVWGNEVKSDLTIPKK
jgi:N6-adenosine-specific RNA methylase IME4